MPAAVRYQQVGKDAGGSWKCLFCPCCITSNAPQVVQAGVGAGRAPQQSSWVETPHRLLLLQLSPPGAGRGPRDTKAMLCWGPGSRQDSGAVATSMRHTGLGAWHTAEEEPGQHYQQMATPIPHHVLHHQYTELPAKLPNPTSSASPLPKIPTEGSPQTELGSPIPSRWWLVSNLGDYIRDQLNLANWDFIQVPDLFSVCIKIFQKTSKPSKCTRGKNLVCFWLSIEEHKHLGSWGQFWPEDHQPQQPHKVSQGCLLGREAAYPHLADQHGGGWGCSRCLPQSQLCPRAVSWEQGTAGLSSEEETDPLPPPFLVGWGLPGQCQGVLAQWRTFKEGKQCTEEELK